jgi:hypothetical protein
MQYLSLNCKRDKKSCKVLSDFYQFSLFIHQQSKILDVHWFFYENIKALIHCLSKSCGYRLSETDLIDNFIFSK